MITVVFNSPITTFSIESVDRGEIKLFFIDLIKFMYLNGCLEHKLISDRLYRKYIKKEDLKGTYHLMKYIELDFLRLHKKKHALYCRIMSAFYSACEETIELEEMGVVRKRRLQIGLFLPYGIDEGRVPDAFFDSLPHTAKPFWLREMSMKEYVEKYSI